ncbi:MAG: AEC family transporter [Sphingobium sp.]|nr:AEC family transporter [Sphingobium sp.]MCP5398043.1 AEC family transporter [Sphingomonas sp.]
MALSSIFPVFAIIMAGYLAGKTGIVPAAAHAQLNRFVIWLALPALMFSIVATTDWHGLWNGDFVIAIMSSSMAVFFIGMALGRLRGLPSADMAVDGLNTSYSNAAYIGLPLFLIALGPNSAPYVIVAATLMLMSLFALSIIMIELGHNRAHGIGHAVAKAGLALIRNPVMIGPAFGLAWWLTGWTLPAPVDAFTHMLGTAASPTALVAIGLFLAERKLGEALHNMAVIRLTAVKLLLHPAITAVIVWPVLNMDAFAGTMAILIAALPTGTGPFMVSSFYARDGKATSGTILLTTIVSVATIAALLSFLPR